jgi:His/Glu/Gln/Arg/opine family amino acid ABC transporter permease subunit
VSAGNADAWYFTTQMLRGAVTTLWMGGISTGIALVAGAPIALLRLRASRLIRAVVVGYIELIRGTPPLIQLYVLYFGLTQYGVNLSPTTAGLIWLSVYGTAYAVEIFRAGLVGIPHGQEEAAVALGLGAYRRFRSVLLPQAVRRMLPAFTNFVILQLKTTPLLYLVGIQEVLSYARLGANQTNQPLAMYSIAALIYIVINVLASRFLGRFQYRMSWAN